MKKLMLIAMMTIAPLMAQEKIEEAFLIRTPQRSYVVDRHKDKVRTISVIAWTDMGTNPTKHYFLSENIDSCFVHQKLDGDLTDISTIEAHYSLPESEFMATLQKVGPVSRIPANLTTSQIFGLLGSAKAHADFLK